jgi:23S rRNA (cytosine1962-C5)-methyltransferase
MPVPRLKLRVSPVAESKIRAGHPWIYETSIRQQNREGKPGELAVVYDRKDTFLGIGLFDPGSALRVRVLHAGKPITLDDTWWKDRLETALEKRRPLFDAETTGFRWIHGESDGWPGLVLDRYADVLVLKIYTAAWLPWLDKIVALLRSQLSPGNLVLRMSRNIQELAAREFSRSNGEVLHGPKITAPVAFLESGLRFEADVLQGQKTGFFLDQRENRRLIETLAVGRDVLNAFSFSGGFSVYAARGGARSVADLDISAHALESARRNFALNRKIAECRHETIQADTFEWLAANPSRKFGLIILDPPSFAKREQERPGALRAYFTLAERSIQHLRQNGVLAASSCSAHVSPEEFFGSVRDAARSCGRTFKELRVTGHPPDHPANFPEANYLKTIYLQF